MATLKGILPTAFCASVDVANERLRVAIADAERAGLSATVPAFKTAKDVLEAHTGITSAWGYVPFLGSDCEQDAAEINTAAQQLVNAVAARGGAVSPVFRPEAAEPTSYGDWVKPLAITAGIAVGVYALSTVLTTMKMFRAPKRRLAGTRSRRPKYDPRKARAKRRKGLDWES